MAQSGLNWTPSDSNFDALAHLSHSPLYLDFTVLLNPSLDSADLWQQATRVDFWIWIWPRLVQEAACWFQCWKNSTCLTDQTPLRCWDCLSLLSWIGTFSLSLAKTAPPSCPKKILRVLFISINLPYTLTWNTVVLSGLILLTATWIRYIASLGLLYRYYFGRCSY